MIIGPVAVREVEGGAIRRSAVLRWAGREFELEVTADAGIADRSSDASGFLCVALPLAMRHRDDLIVEGPVSASLLERCDEIQAIYAAWNPMMRPVPLRADGRDDAGRAETGRRACSLLSRGVDSVFAAARDRAGTKRLDALVMIDGVEPRHDEAVRAEEIRRARVLADRLELPLLVTTTNVRHLTDQAGLDWEDALGAGLSFVGHGLAGGAASVRIPSSDSYETVEPCGSSPLLDPLFSTGRVAIEHDSLAHTRLGKVVWLREHRPDLLEHLKVCYAENRADNCGRCGKCVYTMACLRVAGATELAGEFPATIDLDGLRAMRLPHLKSRIDWAELIVAIDPHGPDAELRRAAVDVLQRSTLEGRGVETELGPTWVSTKWFRNHRLNTALSLVIDGEPYPPLDWDSA